jgi:hypothetical protein
MQQRHDAIVKSPDPAMEFLNQNQQKMFSLRPLRLSVFALAHFTY